LEEEKFLYTNPHKQVRRRGHFGGGDFILACRTCPTQAGAGASGGTPFLIFIRAPISAYHTKRRAETDNIVIFKVLADCTI